MTAGRRAIVALRRGLPSVVTLAVMGALLAALGPTVATMAADEAPRALLDFGLRALTLTVIAGAVTVGAHATPDPDARGPARHLGVADLAASLATALALVLVAALAVAATLAATAAALQSAPSLRAVGLGFAGVALQAAVAAPLAAALHRALPGGPGGLVAAVVLIVGAAHGALRAILDAPSATFALALVPDLDRLSLHGPAVTGAEVTWTWVLPYAAAWSVAASLLALAAERARRP